jgi:hypothetical protein
MAVKPLLAVTGDTVTRPFQLRKNGVPQPLDGMTFELEIKQNPDSATYLGPVTADVDLVEKTFTFTYTYPDEPLEDGREEIVMTDGLGNKKTLTPAGGVEATVKKKIYSS